jgi:PBS lyase HEAT-like repeat
MEHREPGVQCWSMRWSAFRRAYRPSMIIYALVVLLWCAAVTFGQTCEDQNPAHAAALIDRIRYSCERDDTPYSADLFQLAAVADKEAIPALRKLAAWSTDTGPGARCSQWVTGARIALAKLGDEGYREKLNRDEASFIGDDRALMGLIEYLIEHAKDPEMYYDFGDYGVDARDGLLLEIDTIRRRRRVPDLPLPDYSDTGIALWKAYLEKYKGQQMTFPAYTQVADPYLQCLARRVDWGYPDGILAIATEEGPESIQILRKFPPPWKSEMLGYFNTVPFNPAWAAIQGNTQVALAQLGDDEMYRQIVAELNGNGNAFQAVRKLEYLGGKRAVEALVKALDLPEDLVWKAWNKECGNRTFCYPNVNANWKQIWNLKPNGEEISQEICRAMPFHACVVGVLGFMVKNPPLPPGAAGTTENIRAWKEWWTASQHKTEFVVKPQPKFE